MQENAVRIEIRGLRLSAVLFDEAFRLSPEKSLPGLSSPHRHADYEIFFLLNGSLRVQGEGLTGSAQAPATVILPPLFDHTTQIQSSHGFCMYFNLEEKQKSKNSFLPAIQKALKNKITVLPLCEEERFYLEQLAKTALHPGREETQRHLIALLFASLLDRIAPQKSHGETEKHTQYINMIDTFLSRHYREKIRLQDLAERLHLCPRQVSRIIRKKYDCSFSDRLNAHRLGLARVMLKETEESVNAIAEEVGYEYPNYFYALFRKTYGMTPQAYRKSCKHKSVSETT